MYFVGTGDYASNDNALTAATQGLVNPSLIIFMTSRPHMEPVSRELYNKYPNAQIIGGCGYVMNSAGSSRDYVQVVGFGDEVSSIIGIITEINECPLNSIDSLLTNAQAIEAGDDNTVCFEFCTGQSELMVTLLESVLKKPNIPLIGATTFYWESNDLVLDTVCYNGILYENACVYALIRNKNGRVKIFRENIYKIPEKANIHIVSKADRNNCHLYELDHRPACDVYFEETGFDPDKIVSANMRRPLGRIIGEQVFIVAARAILPNGALVTHKRLSTNDAIYIMELGEINDYIEKTLHDIKCWTSKPALVLAINCVCRQVLFEHIDFIDEYCNHMNKMSNCACFVGGGEQAFGQHMNQSMVCAVFE